MFTLPATLSELSLDNPALLYNLLFTAASQALLCVGRSWSPLRAETGFIGCCTPGDNYCCGTSICTCCGSAAAGAGRFRLAFASPWLQPAEGVAAATRFAHGFWRASSARTTTARSCCADGTDICLRRRRSPPGSQS